MASGESIGADLPRTVVTSRLRRDAALYEPAPPRTGKRGRPRTKGARLPTPPELAAAATDWVEVDIDQRGTTVTRRVWHRDVLWYRACPRRLVRLVVVRDPTGAQPDHFFVTSAPAADPATIASGYTGRWSIEVTNRDAKQALGGEVPVLEGPGPGPGRRAVAVAAHRHLVLVPEHPRRTTSCGPALVPPQAHRQLRRRTRRPAQKPVAATNYSHVGQPRAPGENHQHPARRPRRSRLKIINSAKVHYEMAA